jgi:hypothetical protein
MAINDCKQRTRDAQMIRLSLRNDVRRNADGQFEIDLKSNSGDTRGGSGARGFSVRRVCERQTSYRAPGDNAHSDHSSWSAG